MSDSDSTDSNISDNHNGRESVLGVAGYQFEPVVEYIPEQDEDQDNVQLQVQLQVSNQ